MEGLGGEVVLVLEVSGARAFEHFEVEIEVAADAQVHFVSHRAVGRLVVMHYAVVEMGDSICDGQRVGCHRGLGGVGPEGRAEDVGVHAGVVIRGAAVVKKRRKGYRRRLERGV